MSYAWPFALQGVLMFADEWLCHRRRELRRWERVGHAADTLSFLLPLAFVNLFGASAVGLKIYVGLSVASCLFVTKDEWEHVGLCSGFEHWLHALLFMLHPSLLIWIGYLWWNSVGEFALRLGVLGTSLFFVYQVVYWKAWRRDR